MKTILKYFLPCVSAMCISLNMVAQTSLEENSIVRSALDGMFEELDKSRVPTGYLLDYAVDLVELSDYDGTELTDSNYVNRTLLADILRSIRSASVADSASAAIPAVATDMSEPLVSLSSTDVSVAAFKYNYIVANALTDGLIEYDEASGKASDAWEGGVWQNPYGVKHLLAFAPVSSIVKSRNVTYNFPSALFYGNEDLSEIYFDAGDGIGYRRISIGSTVNASYPADGRKVLKLKVITSAGKILESHSVMYAAGTQTAGMSTKKPPFSDEYHETWNGITVSAQMTCYMRDNVSLKKPFIVLEGFEPLELEKLMESADDDYGNMSHDSFAANFYANEDLQDDYDLVYIDWFDSTEDIRANAALFIKLLGEINRMKAEAGSTEKNVVMGQSMGGLVARYALRKMELNGEEHETTTYISHDSPHKGANVPLGALYFVQQLMSMMHGYYNLVNVADLFTGNILTDAEKTVYNVMHSMAARQMLVNYIDPSGNLDNSVHDEWQTELMIMGFPEGDDGSGIQNLAIVNGRAFDIPKTRVYGGHLLYLDGDFQSAFLSDLLGSTIAFFSLLAFGDIIYSMDLEDLFWRVLCPGSLQFNADIEVNPLSQAFAGRKLSEINLSYTKRFLWIIPKTYSIFSSTKYAPETSLYYDDYPGSSYFIMIDDARQDTDTTDNADIPDIPYEQESDSTGRWGDYSLRMGVTHRIMFVPTASALSVNGDLNPSDFTRDYYSNVPEPEVETAFDAYFLCDTSYRHIAMTASMFDWVANMLGSEISGPDFVGEHEEQYCLVGYDGPVTWSTSNGAIAVIDQSGKLTPLSAGTVKVIAEYATPGKLYRKTKEIVVDYMPEMAITYEYLPGAGIRFIAKCVDQDDNERLLRAVEEGYLYYEWSRVDEEGGLIVEKSSSDIYDYMPYEDEYLTVGLKMVDKGNNCGHSLSVSFDLRTPVSFNYSYVIVNSAREIYFIKPDNTYDKGYPSEQFTVAFRGPGFDSASGDGVDVTPPGDQYDLYMEGDECYISYPTEDGMAYMDGTKYGTAPDCCWTFPFFDSEMFLDELEIVGTEIIVIGDDNPYINIGVRRIGREGVIGTVGGSYEKGRYRVMSHVFEELHVCNSSKEAIQKMPFVILYKEEFPESYEPPIGGGGGGDDGDGPIGGVIDNPGMSW